MNKEEQIAEIGLIIHKGHDYDGCYSSSDIAEALYNAGYRKPEALNDLLEACEGLLKIVHVITDDEKSVFDKAEKAIAKAKGER